MSISSIFIGAAVVVFALAAFSIGKDFPMLFIGLALFAAGHLPFGSIRA